MVGKEYQPLPTSDRAVGDNGVSYNSPFTYDKKSKDYSYFVDMDDARETYEPEKVFHQSLLLRLLSHVLTILSYSAFIIALPITYWICIKRVGTSQKMIVFRLGKMIGAKGPGTVLVFPWLDRYQTVDVGDAAFSVPPQQLITHDGGIIEIGAEVQYAITDVVVMVREVADHQDILRSLAKTVLVRLLAKKQVSKLVKEKNICASEIMADLNRQVRKWGLDVRCVSLSEAKVLKRPEGNNGIAPLLQSLGMKEKSAYPSPMEFARSIHAPPGEPVDVEGGVVAGGALGGVGGHQEEKGLNLNSIVESAEVGHCDWKTCLQTILSQEATLEPETHGLYSVNLTDASESLFVQIDGTGSKVVLACEFEGEHKADVSINISSSDLAGVLKGSLPPLQAYLTGRISTSGDVRKLMLFDKLSNRSHKPGATFNL